MPGGWAGDTNNAFTKAGRTAEQQQFFEVTSKLFTWRKSKEVIHTGKTTQYIPDNNVYVYFRYNDKETVMVVVNNAPDTKTFNTARFAESIKSHKSGKDVISGKTVDVSSSITLEAKSVLVLELN